MNIGINLDSKWRYDEIISAFLENKVDRTFVCIEHPQFDAAMSALKDAGITVENFHAPYNNLNSIWYEGEEGDDMLSRLLKSVDACVKHGVKLMVSHVSGRGPMPPISKIGVARFTEFIEYATKNGVTIAFESHHYVENVKFMIDNFPQVRFCLDNGHEYAFTPGVRYMPMWGDLLVATHISDNEDNTTFDMHMIPFDGDIDLSLAARELAESGYQGTIMLELKPGNHKMYDDVSIGDYYRRAAESARKFADMVESFKR